MRLGRVILLALTAAACRPADAADSAAEVLRRWVAAVERDDPEAAYALLSRDARRRTDFRQFEQRWREDRAEIVAAARETRARLEEAPPALSADVIASPLRVSVRRERLAGGELAWRLEQQPSAASSAARTPEEALAAFIEAVRLEQAALALRVFPPSQRRQLQRDLESRLAQLRAVPRMTLRGPTAIATYPSGLRIRLSLENDEWRVLGVED